MQSESFKQKYRYDQATPVMQQYLNVKANHLECLVLFRMGDFYELFYEDAVTASRILNIALTKRGKTNDEEISMCGVPHHSIENYLNKLLAEGFKVAICDQLETPEEAKKRGGYKAVVKRDVVRIITPGTIIEESLLANSEPNYLCAIAINKNKAAICRLDLSTSEISIISLPANEIINEITRLKPNEILLSEKYRLSDLANYISSSLDKMISFQVDSFFASAKCEKIVKNFYAISAINAIGELEHISISALGAVLEYISITQKNNFPKLPFPKIESYLKFMSIDSSTRQNLEITSSPGNNKNSLFNIIDQTQSNAGSRLLYRYLSAPLISIEKINHRLSITEFFLKNIVLTEVLRSSIKKTADIERCIARLSMNRSTAKDLLSIKNTIEIAETIYHQFTSEVGKNIPTYIEKMIAPLLGNSEIYSIIEEAIKDNASNVLNDGNIIKHEFHPKVKELHDLLDNGSKHIDKLRDKYRKITGVETLKINHNNVIGLFIDVTVRNIDKINDPIFIHRQSTINSARYTTTELQELETKMINAKQLVIALEKQLYDEVVAKIIEKQETLFSLAKALSRIDLFCALAYQADLHDYCKPTMTEDLTLDIKAGRHPVIEHSLNKNSANFVSNDCFMNFDQRIWLITGPNMSGKSTFLRQNALITILAHIGSFVPAGSALIGLTDKIFSRIGAGDDLSRGQSTFMVEMLETSAIISQSTNRSLIILDEVGRGTSTYDGVAIASAVLEHIHDKIRARCLFATHYHELTRMDNILPAIVNYTIAINETNNKITFLHRIIKGAADKSYGVHVAKLAGLPDSVIKRANALLKKLEKDSIKTNKDILQGESMNMNLFDTQSLKEPHVQVINEKYEELYRKITLINPDDLTARDALDLLYELKDIAAKKHEVTESY